MIDEYNYRWKADAYAPAIIPMARIAEHMGDLAALLSEPENVHFEHLEEGSIVLVQRIEAPADALKAFGSLDGTLIRIGGK